MPNIDTNSIVESIVALLTALGMIIATIAAARAQLAKVPIEGRKAENEDRKDDADIVAKYQGIATAQAIENDKIRAEMEDIRAQASKDLATIRSEVEALRQKLDERDAIIHAKDDQIVAITHAASDLQDWIARLQYQIKSLPGDYKPVPFRSSYKDVDTQRWADVERKTGPLNKDVRGGGS